MRKLTLLSAVLLALLFTQSSWAGEYKYTSNPHLPIQSAQTTLDAIYVPANVNVSDVRVGIYAKTVMYNSLRILLTSPNGFQVMLKQETRAVQYGALGSENSYLLFREDGNAWGDQPNDMTIAPAERLSQLNGEASMGWWQLKIVDDRALVANPQNGFLEGWVLMFNRQLIEPIIPINPPVHRIWPGGASIVGQINGGSSTLTEPNRAQIPNEDGATLLCLNENENPNVVLGVNGDCFPFEVTGHPGALIGVDANGFAAGRFRVTLTVQTNYIPGSPFLPGLTEDIAIYFGRVPDADYSPPLPAPPVISDPAFHAKVASDWPVGGGNFVNELQGGSGLGSQFMGGVLLSTCYTPIAGHIEGYDRITFDDLALESITGITVPDQTDPFTGTYKPAEALGTMNGLPLDGLYYVTVYDGFGDNQSDTTKFGHIRITYMEIEYIVGGGEIADPVRHQGIAGPLMGVPIPGTFTGAPFGYLSDVVGVIPPYSLHAKDQDPLLVMWATNKLYPKDAVGTERIMAVNQSNYAPPSATHYHGPYAYPGTLDEDPLISGMLVNADVLLLPTGDYNLRVNLMQARYDDDLSDNQFESEVINVNKTTLSYIGDQVLFWNEFQNHGTGVVASANLGPDQGIGKTFSLFKFPTTTVTSVDYKFDDGTVITPRSDIRISIWACNGFIGAPTTLVGRSHSITMNEYIEGNWRSFPIYPVDIDGNPDLTSGSVNLAPGSYAVMMENVSQNGDAVMIYPYTYGMIPTLEDRHFSYQFNDKFGPIGPTSTLGTAMGYGTTDNTAAPTNALGGSFLSTWGNWSLPMRLNMTSLNDFAVNYVRFSSQTSPTESIAVAQPVTPTVNVSSLSGQGGLNKDFNIYLAVYDAGNNLLYSDMVNIANAPYYGISGYATMGINMASWTPTSGGLYTVKAYFTRNPDDQNPINDGIEYVLFVSANPVIAYGNDVDQKDLNSAIDELAKSGARPELVNIDSDNLSRFEGSTIYFVGRMNDNSKAVLSEAMNNGNDVAFVYDRSARIGATVGNIDNLYGIDRGNVNYADMKLGMEVDDNLAPTAFVTPVDAPQIQTKDDLISYLATGNLKIEPVEESAEVSYEAFTNVMPVAISSEYGAVGFVSTNLGDLGIVYTVPSARKSGSVVDQAAPTAFELGQNYPNPFNPSTVISYTLSEASVITLRVMDVLGREVATLVNTTQDAGRFAVSWKGLDNSGAAVASGNYFYRIDAVPTSGAAAFSGMKKMVLSK